MKRELWARAIGEMAADAAEFLAKNYPRHLVELFTLVGKYMSLSYLRYHVPVTIADVSDYRRCPICRVRCSTDGSRPDCTDCVFEGSDGYCNELYVHMRHVAMTSTPMETAFILREVADDIIDKGGKDAPSTTPSPALDVAGREEV